MRTGQSKRRRAEGEAEEREGEAREDEGTKYNNEGLIWSGAARERALPQNAERSSGQWAGREAQSAERRRRRRPRASGECGT